MATGREAPLGQVANHSTLVPALPQHWTRLTILVWGFSFIIIGMSAFVVGWDGEQFWFLAWLVLITLSGMALSLLLSRLILRVESMHWLPQAALLFLGSALATICQALLDHLLWSAFATAEEAAPDTFVHGVLFNILFYVWIFGIYAIGLKILRVLQHARERDAEIARSRAAAGRAKLAALRYQVQPDVLFATLASAADMVERGKDNEAGELVDRLSGFLRGQLAADSDGDSTLGDEMEALDDYIALERSRSRVAIELNVDSPLALDEIPGPTFIVQPLIEKRLCSVFAAGVEAIRIDIAIKQENQRIVISVRDDCALPAEADFGDIRDRMNLQYGADAGLSLARTGFSARLDLPLQ